MSAATDSLSTSELRFERLLDANVSMVWRWIVDPELRARWFMGGPTDLRPDGMLGLTMNHDRLSDGPVPTPERYREYSGKSWSERIVQVIPEQLLAFEWDGGAEGVVTITLTSEGERTRLVLVHSGITGRDSAINFAGGWSAHLAVLELRLKGEPVANFWALHAEAEATIEQRLGQVD